jgi:hypothetical protein
MVALLLADSLYRVASSPSRVCAGGVGPLAVVSARFATIITCLSRAPDEHPRDRAMRRPNGGPNHGDGESRRGAARHVTAPCPYVTYDARTHVTHTMAVCTTRRARCDAICFGSSTRMDGARAQAVTTVNCAAPPSDHTTRSVCDRHNTDIVTSTGSARWCGPSTAARPLHHTSGVPFRCCRREQRRCCAINSHRGYWRACRSALFIRSARRNYATRQYTVRAHASVSALCVASSIFSREDDCSTVDSAISFFSLSFDPSTAHPSLLVLRVCHFVLSLVMQTSSIIRCRQ